VGVAIQILVLRTGNPILFSDDRYIAPSKTRYVKELARVVSENEIRSALSEKLNSRLQ